MTHSLWLDRPRPTYDAPPGDERWDVAVVGAGLTGLVTALLLARAGKRVGVVEAGIVGGLTTGHTTAKVSLLQGSKLSRLVERQPRTAVDSYVRAQRVGMDWLLGYCEEAGVAVQPRDAITFAATSREVGTARAEYDAARAAGLSVTWEDRLDLPFPHHGGTVLADQAQLDPVALLDALAAEVRRQGGTVHEQCRVTAVHRDGVTLESGARAHAGHVVLATGSPIVDRGLHFAQLSPERSYLLAFRGGTSLPMVISAGQDARSVRDVPPPDGTDTDGVFLVGGSGHVVGRARSERAHLDDLRSWTRRWFPGAEETHAWSAQDYRSYDGMPIVGPAPMSEDRILVATGYDKWGLTNAPAAALTLAGQILGAPVTDAAGALLERHPFSPPALVSAAATNACVALELVRDGVRAPHRCTHLGGALRWNDAEESWDCPLHGSRFTTDGSVIEGPATKAVGSLKQSDR